jgi:hypothetical protein
VTSEEAHQAYKGELKVPQLRTLMFVTLAKSAKTRAKEKE